ncbi:MAG TPA: hypothetical protein PLZ12_05795 [Saprospiraceae bacterium]|nr:hypothetical protein [Saprospiraceae bacterium]
MKTKLLYILSSSEADTYLESALISIYSARFRMPDANITLLVDDITNNSFTGSRKELLNFITENIVVNFDIDIDFKVRSRLLKTNMRNHVSGDFLYIDCDTLIASSLNDIDNCKFDIAAVLDGHTVLRKHPVYEIFAKQSSVFNYPFEKVENYFSGGAMYVKDSKKTRSFFDNWHKNYKLGLQYGISQDEPSLAKTNFDFGNIIHELPGEWNCQIRLGSLYLKDLKILHFWSKRNMPISVLGTKDFHFKLRNEGLTKHAIFIINYQYTFLEPLGLVANEDLYFNFSPLYEEVRKRFIEENGISYFGNGLSFLEKVDTKVTRTRLGKLFISVNKLIFMLEYFIFSKCTKFNEKK